MKNLNLKENEKEEILKFLNEEDYDYIKKNVNKINNILNIFDKYGLKDKVLILISKTYIFYESEEYIENQLKNNIEKIDDINISIDLIDELFA